MSTIKIIAKICFFILVVFISFNLLDSEALAADDTAGWRPVFDLVMRWLNFGIIVFVLIKYARTPIKNFLLNRREEVGREIRKIEEEKEKANEKIQETTRMLADSEVRFDKIKERIISEGEKKKQQIIENAQQESKILFEETRKKIANQLREAQKDFKSKLVDSAVALAIEQLPDEITAEDNQKLIHLFLDSTSAK
ncbi:MAG: ATP synthase F0 subunit B [Desulfobacterales bacterium]|nr:ATP synthase F0 subunit B [Desulfobacterales bacterium]